ncbi:MAG: sulfurtransferase, partial [Candidatus Omnitrophica bacterium]|nr:sulfurtransferase [Candidatus Omnitrophota bacterium]
MINESPHVRTCCRGTFGKVFVLFISIVTFYLFSNNIAFAINLGLIETITLKQHLSSWVILDARPRAEWMAGHITGALPFSWEDYTRTDENGIPYRVWPPKDLAKALGEMGIDENTSIVVYGDTDKSWGGEGWNCWVFAWLGHKGPIRVLAGGIQAWRNNNFPFETVSSKVKMPARRYQVRLNPQFDIATEELKKTKSGLTLIDTRSTLEWLKGKIPGAIH